MRTKRYPFKILICYLLLLLILNRVPETQRYGPMWIKISGPIKPWAMIRFKSLFGNTIVIWIFPNESLRKRVKYCHRVQKFLWNVCNYCQWIEIYTHEMFSMYLTAKIWVFLPSGGFRSVLLRPLAWIHVKRCAKYVFKFRNTICFQTFVISFFNKNVK